MKRIIVFKKGYKLIFCSRSYKLFQKYTWSISQKTPKHFYLQRWDKGKYKLLHRELFDNIQDGFVIDHINRNPLDNRLVNLRIVTPSENIRNKTKQKGLTSKYLGIAKVNNKYRAYLTYNGIWYHIGYFKTQLEAKKARDSFIKKMK